jgi:hypothetical protein
VQTVRSDLLIISLRIKAKCRPETGFLTTIVLLSLMPGTLCLTTYFYYLFCLSCLDLPDVYRELLEPSLIDRVLILDCPFNTKPEALANEDDTD